MIPNSNRGFLKTIILLIIALALLKYFFGVSLKDLWTNEVTQNLWSIIKSLFNVLWDIVILFLNFVKELISTARDFVSGLNK